MENDFTLPEEDMDYLENYNGSSKMIVEGRHRWLIMDDFLLPSGYNLEKVSLALRIDAGYPTSQIDMAYFHPALFRKDGKPIGATTNQPLLGKNFQRWSRHRTSQNPWRVGIDNLQSHVLLVEYWLMREFNIR